MDFLPYKGKGYVEIKIKVVGNRRHAIKLSGRLLYAGYCANFTVHMKFSLHYFQSAKTGYWGISGLVDLGKTSLPK